MPINLNWHRIRIVRVPPLKIFWGTSRPMRGQHFKLSTNQKPPFRPDSRCWSNLWSTNPTPMHQLTENQVPLEYQLTADWQTLYWHWTNNWMPIDCQWNVNGLQWNVKEMSIELKRNVNLIQWNATWQHCHKNVNRMSMECQWSVNWITMQCQCNVIAMWM